MRLISASSLQRIAECPASAVLPGVNLPSSTFATDGTAIHAYVRNKLHGVACLVAPEIADKCAAIDMTPILELIGDSEFHTELAICYNVFSEEARFIGSDIGRSYPTPERGEVFGTGDLYVNKISSGVVLDFKTGFYRVTDVARNWQMRLGALSFAQAAGLRTIEMVIAYLSEDGTSWTFDRCTATGMDLDHWAEELRHIYERVEAASAAYDSGREALDVSPSEDNCRYCPCVVSCPVKTQLVKTMVTELKPLELAELSPTQLGECWSQIQAWKKVLENMEEGLCDIAAQSPIPLPSGKVLKVVQTPRESVKGDIAYRVLSEAFGPERAMQVCKLHATKEAFKTLGPDGKKALDLVRSKGGINTSFSNSVKEVKNGR